MRPKFRAWDKREDMKRFLPDSFLEQLYLRQDGKIIWWSALKGFTEVSDIFEINLFTGLLDKNGKEIFEGDIIELKHPYKGRYHKGVVEMIDWRWTMRNFFQGQLDIPNEPFSVGTEYIEVIGNVYQNKDLLQ